MMTIQIEKIHHVAYRCKDAKETVEWYKKNLNMDFILAFAEDYVPSTKAFDPYMHLFLDAGNGVNVLGITNHGIFHSIYFFDPNGHRLELAYDDEKAPQKIAMITEEMKHEMLEEWSKNKRAPHHTHFLHAAELDDNAADAKVDA